MGEALGQPLHAYADGVGVDHAERKLVIGTAPGARRRRSTYPIAPITMNTTTTTNTENAAAGPSASSVMFSRILTVMSVQPIETRKMVALIAVIERMKTTPRPGT